MVSRGGSPAPSRPPRRIHEAAKAHKAVEQELAHAVNTSALALSEALSNKAAGAAEVSRGGLGRGGVVPPPSRCPPPPRCPSLRPSFSAGTRRWRWC